MLFVVAIVLFLLNMDGLDPVGPELMLKKEQLHDAQISAELEKNKTDDEIADLLRARSKLRQEEEAKSEQVGFLKDEVDFMSPKLKRSKELLDDVLSQVTLLEEKDVNASRLIEEALEEHKPFYSRIDDLKAEKEQITSNVTTAERNLDKLDTNYSSLESKRDTSRKSFEDAMKEMRSEMIEPNTVFFADEISVEIENVSPNKSGFFVKKGLEDGLRSGFRFLAYDKFLGDRASPFFLRCSLVEPNYSFMEMDGDPLNASAELLLAGQKLFLIRTGESTITTNLEQFDEFD